MLKSSSTISCSAILLSSSVTGVWAQDNSAYVANATRVETAPAIDGHLDDPVWQAAIPITGFVQAEPLDGQPATERTEVRIVYDEETLFVGVALYDSQPDRIVVTDSRRDSDMNDTDSFQLILDTYHDQQNGFVFGTNPAGIEYDGQVAGEEGGRGGGGGGGGNVARFGGAGGGGGFNLSWDATWQVRTRIDEAGWFAEFAIPLRTLRYGVERPQVWGLNFRRVIRRKREVVYWSPVSRIYRLARLSSAGDLVGLELDAPRNFKVTPFVVSSRLRDYAAESGMEDPKAVYDSDVGIDAKFGVTPSLNLDVTYNTDFAQVEVDEQQINLTRFNLFFPEKRQFFLENAGTFAFGKSGVNLFFSRRIGIDTDTGAPVPIVGGARLTGKTGGFNVGLLQMETDDVPSESPADVVPRNGFTVARVTRELPNRSRVGGMFLGRWSRGADGEDWNRGWGLDGKLGIGDSWTIDGYVAGTETARGFEGDEGEEGSGGLEHAFNGEVAYRRPGGNFALGYTEVDQGFNPEVGFLARAGGFRSVNGRAFLLLRPDIAWLREWRPHVFFTSFWDLEGSLQSRFFHVDPVQLDLENGTVMSVSPNFIVEGLKQDFEIFPVRGSQEAIVVPAGTYRTSDVSAMVTTNRSARLSVQGRVTNGGFLSGELRNVSLTISARRGSTVQSSIQWDRNDVELPQGAFVTNLIRWRLNYSFTPSTFLQGLVQYNDRDSNWSMNVRFGWLNAASTGLFIVYNDTEGLDGLGPVNRTFAVKYSRQFDILR